MARIVRAVANDGGIPTGLPILVDESMAIIEPAFAYLLYIATIPGRTRSPQTLRAYSENLLDWFDSLEQSNIAWNEVTRATLAAYRRRHEEQRSPRTQRPYALPTIKARLGAVIRFYEWAHREGWIDKVPFGYVRVRISRRHEPFLAHTQRNTGWRMANELTLRTHEKVRRALNPDETRRLINALRQPYRLMAEWALGTGMRRMEICALTLYQLPEPMDLRTRDNQLVGVPLTITKGSKPRDAIAPLLLLDRTRNYINEARDQVVRARKRLDRSYRAGDAVFLNRVGEAVKPNRMSNAFKDAYRANKIAADLHCLRHTFAIRTLNALMNRQRQGAQINPLLTLKILMGHSTIAVTEKYLESLTLRLDHIAEDLAYLYGDVIDEEEKPEEVGHALEGTVQMGSQSGKDSASAERVTTRCNALGPQRT